MVSDMQEGCLVPVISFHLKETNELEQKFCNSLPDNTNLISAPHSLHFTHKVQFEFSSEHSYIQV